MLLALWLHFREFSYLNALFCLFSCFYIGIWKALLSQTQDKCPLILGNLDDYSSSLCFKLAPAVILRYCKEVKWVSEITGSSIKTFIWNFYISKIINHCVWQVFFLIYFLVDIKMILKKISKQWQERIIYVQKKNIITYIFHDSFLMMKEKLNDGINSLLMW